MELVTESLGFQGFAVFRNQNFDTKTIAASNQVQNGSGLPAAMGPMNLNDKSIVEIAEYSRQSSEWLKKIYDLIKSRDNSDAFAQ